MATPTTVRRFKRIRIGDVSVYKHRASYWIYYREDSTPKRQRVGKNLNEAKAVAAQVNAQLASRQPTLFSFHAISIDELIHRWLEYHEHVLGSSLATINRYRTATQHLRSFQATGHAHEVDAEAFVRHLRNVEVAPNGHPNTAKRRLSDKGVKFILETCRAMFNYAAKQRLVPPYFENPFGRLPLDRMLIEDAKPIHVFTADQEQAFLGACDRWQLPSATAGA